jgi:hypothetical protein
MANEEILKILKQGVQAWNEWSMQNRKLRGKDPAYVRPDLSFADLGQRDLQRIDLRGVMLDNATLRGCDLRHARLGGAWLSHADLRADLRIANFRSAALDRADLSGADLRGTDFYDAELDRATLRCADLGGADMRGARFGRSDLSEASLSYTIFGFNDLSAVKGLDTVVHRGPSTIGIDTIYESKGKIPEAFLRGAGVPEDFITYMKSLVGKPIEFYSCFISYSSKDDDFARRLHADLQQYGVRVWFAPKDLKIGDKFRTRIDESIRIYDKLLLVLSTNSIQSPWVEDEVETALEKERTEDKPVLFPIRLDDAVRDTEQAWAASLRRTRHIGDFRTWKNNDAYKEAFEQLLRDLKADKMVASE